jgi:RimK family alpha-L-glutamate ligase
MQYMTANEILHNLLLDYTTVHEMNENLFHDSEQVMKLFNLASVSERLNNVNEASLDEVSQKNLRKYGENYLKLVETVVAKNPEKNSDLMIKEELSLYDKPDPKNVSIVSEKPVKEYWFKTLLLFTGDKSVHNKTLNNIKSALEFHQEVNLVIFNVKNLKYTIDEKDIITIDDGQEKITLENNSNLDTLIITRLSIVENSEAVECVNHLCDQGFMVINNPKYMNVACDKYKTSQLFSKFDIPQPRYCLVTKGDVEEGMESLLEKLRLIYPNLSDYYNADEETKKKMKAEVESQKYVVKILHGHGGTGIFLVHHQEILSVLQGLFAIAPEEELLIQRKEDGDGGDIRVHVITLGDKQTIIGAMKRKKLGDDFRSNISLGAVGEKVELTEEQKDIALKVAKISNLIWCAVDIMPLVKDSNKEIGDNVVLEYNTSPGTDGISEVIGHNLVEYLFDTIDDAEQIQLTPKEIDWITPVELTIKDDFSIVENAKFDTGNGSKASTLEVDEIVKYDKDSKKISFKIEDKQFDFDVITEITPKVGDKNVVRPVVKLNQLKVGKRILKDVDFAIVENRNKSTKILINRDLMRKMFFIINPFKRFYKKL